MGTSQDQFDQNVVAAYRLFAFNEDVCHVNDQIGPDIP